MAPPLVKVQIDFEVRVALVIIKRSSGRRGEGALGKVKTVPRQLREIRQSVADSQQAAGTCCDARNGPSLAPVVLEENQ